MWLTETSLAKDKRFLSPIYIKIRFRRFHAYCSTLTEASGRGSIRERPDFEKREGEGKKRTAKTLRDTTINALKEMPVISPVDKLWLLDWPSDLDTLLLGAIRGLGETFPVNIATRNANKVIRDKLLLLYKPT
jgi:hypothetical protein